MSSMNPPVETGSPYSPTSPSTDPRTDEGQGHGTSAIKRDLSQLKSDLRALGNDVAGLAKGGTDAATHKLKGALESGKHIGSKGLSGLGEQVKEHPLAAVGIAMGVGVLVGMLLKRD